MSEQTKIEWCDATWNPWIGCTKVSPGCAHCYAENTTRARVLRSQGQETWGKGAKRSRTSDGNWKKPLAWQSLASKDHAGIQRMKVFPSLCDWLDDEVPIEWLADFLKLIHDTPNLDYLLLTKRPENWTRRIEAARNFMMAHDADVSIWLHNWLPRQARPPGMIGKQGIAGWDANDGTPPQNIWLGVSAENQAMADKRIPELLKIPARVRFVSAEPLLGPIDFKISPLATVSNAHTGATISTNFPRCDGEARLDWVIFGGESGPHARPCNVEWICDGVKQCKAAGVAAFVKQLGSHCIGPANTTSVDGYPSRDDKPVDWQLDDPKGGDMAEWPEDLRIREFPQFKV